jgi:hypothetical protein
MARVMPRAPHIRHKVFEVRPRQRALGGMHPESLVDPSRAWLLGPVLNVFVAVHNQPRLRLTDRQRTHRRHRHPRQQRMLPDGHSS